MARRGKKNKTQKSKTKSTASGPSIGSIVSSVAKEVLPMLISMIPFPTSGASAMATPQLGLKRGYDQSMALSAPSANGTYVKHGKAAITTNVNGMRVKHREYVEDITFGDPGTYLNVVAEPINPGNRNLFPWLSSIATRFETYTFHSLRFIYEPQCGTDSQGTVMLAVDFDAVDDPPVDKLQIMTYDGAVRSPPWFAGVYECSQSNLHKYKEYFITPSLTTPTSTDVKTYFVGNVFVATQSLAAAFTSGELYVEYDVSFRTPQLDGIGALQSYLRMVNKITPNAWAQNFPDKGLLDVLWLIADYDPMYYVGHTQGAIIPNSGSYLVVVGWSGVQATDTITNMAITTTNPPNGLEQASIWNMVGYTGGTNEDVTEAAIVTQLNGPVYFQIEGGTAIPNGVNFQIVIAPIDHELYNFLGPFSSPPFGATMTRIQRILTKGKARANVLRYEEPYAVTPETTVATPAITTVAAQNYQKPNNCLYMKMNGR